MKNSSKNNYLGKNNKHYKKNSNSNFPSKNTNSSKNNKFSKYSDKNNSVINSSEGEKNKINFSFANRRKPNAKSNLEFYNKSRDINQEFTNKKIFDDWIWGKHSVFEALTSERAINRIWCTTEIFSS